MSDELQTQQLLERLDRARVPRPAFERALHDELFGRAGDVIDIDDDVTIVELEPAAVVPLDERRRRSPVRVLLAVAMIALLAIGTVLAVTQFSGGDDDLATRTGSETAQEVARACTTFNDDAFGDLGRDRLLGPDRAQEFEDPVVARRLMTDLRDAIETFAADLRSAGISDPELTRLLGLAAANAARDLPTVDQGATGSPLVNNLDSVNTNLLEVQRRLIALGVIECL